MQSSRLNMYTVLQLKCTGSNCCWSCSCTTVVLIHLYLKNSSSATVLDSKGQLASWAIFDPPCAASSLAISGSTTTAASCPSRIGRE